jgi:hypothetical protein
MQQSKSLRQALAIILITLWVLSLGYNPVRELHYTFLDGLQTALFDWQSGMPWWARLILGLPLLSLIVTTTLYWLKEQENPAIRYGMVRLSMRLTGMIYIAYNSFIFWGQDIISTFITFYLDVEHDTLIRGLQWMLGENFLWSHGINLAFILGFAMLNALYLKYSQLEAIHRNASILPITLPPAPIAYQPPTMPPLPLLLR